MGIKKNLILAFISMLFVLASPVHVNAMKPANNPFADSLSSIKEAEKIVQRVKEIQLIDRNTLSTSEKRKLKKELLAIKKKIDSHQVVYISVGVIVVALVLILLVLL